MFTKLSEILKLFLTMGLVAFGGPAAHIAMLQREVVEKRSWLDEDHFLDLIGITSLIPGPNSTEMVLHCGYHRAGVWGLLVAGISFIFPACLLTGILAFLYVKAHEIGNFSQYLIGIKPVVIILIALALKKLGKKALKSNELWIIALFVFALGFSPLSEVLGLFLGAIIGFTYFKVKNNHALKSISLFPLTIVFLKIGSVLFGSGYVLIAYLQDEIVDKRGWLTSSQIADAVAFGQYTPGPVLSTSTFVGYQLAEVPGAILATAGIFLPSFLFVLIANPFIPKMRKSKNLRLLLDCLNASAVGLMAYALVPLASASVQNIGAIIVFIICLIIVYLKPKVSSLKLVSFALALGALIGHFQ